MTDMVKFRRSTALDAVERGQLCAGCGLCAGISDGAVAMGTFPPGYSRPAQTRTLTDAQEATIAKACPGLVINDWAQPTTDASSHSAWGPYLSCLTGYATDPDVRYKGSSGGAVSALAIHALKIGLAKNVLHVFQDPQHPTRNVMQTSSSAAEVIAGSGSRYAASSPLEDVEQHLSSGVPTVFIGKPCDVSALRSLALLDKRVDRVFPVMLSFFCGGIPSHSGADRIVEDMGLDPARLKNFRYRGEGWPGLTVAEQRNGAKATMLYEKSWGDFLSKQVQFRCKICPDAVGGTADIACADAWYGGETGYPQFAEQDGRSLIMVRTARGQELLEDAVNSKALRTETLPIGEIDLMQPAQARRKRQVAARVLAAKVAGKPTPKMDGLDLSKAVKEESPIALAREFLGTLRRIFTKRF